MVECHFCGRMVDSVMVAVEQNWTPCFWDGDDCCLDAVCLECAEKHLQVGEDGEDEVKRADVAHVV